MRTQIEQWKKDIYDRVDEIDPCGDHLWRSIALGYFIGLGLSIEEAEDSVRMADEEGLI